MALDRSFTQKVNAFTRRVEHWREAAKEIRDNPEKALLDFEVAAEELRTAEEELRQQNDELLSTQMMLERERSRYRDLFQFAPDGYLVTDERGVIRENNRAAGRMLGLQPQFLVGKSLMKYIHPDDVPGTRHHMAALEHTHAPTEWTARIVPRELPFFFATVTITAIVLDTGIGQRFTGIRWQLRDATREVRLATENQNLSAELERLKREQESHILTAELVQARAARQEALDANHAKDLFLALLGHELRNPLAPAITTVETLLADSNIDPALCNSLEIIHRNLLMERRLLDDMMDITRIMHGKLELRLEPVALPPLLEELATSARDQLSQKDLRLIVDNPQSNCTVHADPVRLRQIFWNLLNNAIKFTPRGGTITLRLMCDFPLRRVTIEVSDTGVGIPSESLQSIFNAFEQTSSSFARAQGGVGLGLSIVRSLVEAHHGSIEAHSAGTGRGSTFRVQLPILEVAPHTARALPIVESRSTSMPIPLPPPVSEAAHPPALSICVVEDHADTLHAFTKLLRQFGHHVSPAQSLAEAAELLRNSSFDVLFCDGQLSDGTAEELLGRVPAHRVRKKVVLSGNVSTSDAVQTQPVGYDEYLLKPVSIAELQNLLARSMQA